MRIHVLGGLLAASLALGCGGKGGGNPAIDAGSVDVDAGGHAAAALAQCEADLATRWATTPPTTGLGSASARASYTSVVGKIMADYAVPAGAVAVTQNGRLVLALGLGLADREEAQPAHADQLFRLASLSKQITAAAILHLVEDGQLSLDDRVFDILTGYDPVPGATVNPQLASITIRQLLHHAGGWNRDTEAVGDPMFQSAAIAQALGQPAPADTDMIIRYMRDKPLTYAPGTATCYSNFGYALLGRVIARKSGMAYDAYVRQHVLAPAGISDMAIGRTRAELRADHEVRYYGYPGEPLAQASVFPDVSGPVPWEYGGWYLEAMDSHGAWIASPIDLLRFQATIDQRPTPADQLGATSEAAMVANPSLPACRTDGGTDPASASYWYGFGLSANSAGNYWHTGSLDGTSTEDVIAANGFSWSAFFDSRPADVNGFSARLDQDLWTALEGAGTWTVRDLFDQYPDYTAWTPAADFATALAAAQAAGRYPSRLEGELAGAGAMYRARFAPAAPGTTPDVALGVDCLDYQARQTAADAAGRAVVSLQSYRDAAGVRRYQAVWAAP